MRRVVVTGMGGVTSLGQNWETVKAGLLAHRNAVRRMHEWDDIEGLNARLGAPVLDFRLPEHYTRKRIRSMGRVSLLSTRATELALEQAGLIDDPVIKSGRTGIAYGSCTGSTRAVADFGEMIVNRNTRGITATTYVQMMPHTTAVNTGLFFGITGRVIPTPSACTSGSQAIGYAWEAIRHGYQDVMVAGGAEELCPSEVAVFDTLFAASTRNDEPELTPRPFDANRDGLVIGEGACTLVLEEFEHARARGARIYAELVGFATNCDATHITQPNSKTMRICMEEALRTAGLAPSDIGYLSAHGTATSRGDCAESNATASLFGNRTPVSSLKSFFGHTLGACGRSSSSECKSKSKPKNKRGVRTDAPFWLYGSHLRGGGRTQRSEHQLLPEPLGDERLGSFAVLGAQGVEHLFVKGQHVRVPAVLEFVRAAFEIVHRVKEERGRKDLQHAVAASLEDGLPELRVEL